MGKILLVDDDARNLRLAAAALEHGGHEVLTADCGSKGVAMAQEHAPDLVLMDVNMPDISGIVALKALRALPQTADLTVVALTAMAMRGDEERLLAQGFDGYLEKPIRYQLLLSSVTAFLAR